MNQTPKNGGEISENFFLLLLETLEITSALSKQQYYSSSNNSGRIGDGSSVCSGKTAQDPKTTSKCPTVHNNRRRRSIQQQQLLLLRICIEKKIHFCHQTWTAMVAKFIIVILVYWVQKIGFARFYSLLRAASCKSQ